MDMLQIYVVFSLKTTIHVQYFNISGHVGETCPFLSTPWKSAIYAPAERAISSYNAFIHLTSGSKLQFCKSFIKAFAV
jgi:hypothetical protein